ncbi:MAG: hypothetical protein O2968_13495 [Acidobacteria bacterium]|nr:hypothetical protein [Acidobacteriota bacterium]
MTDAAILEFDRAPCCVLTTDWQLSARLEDLGRSVLNYNHFRFKLQANKSAGPGIGSL